LALSQVDLPEAGTPTIKTSFLTLGSTMTRASFFFAEFQAAFTRSGDQTYSPVS